MAKYYHKYEIPPSVVNIVKTICADYERRDRMIRFSTVSGEVLDRYIALNAVVDGALETVECNIRCELLRDIVLSRGYHFSAVSPFISKNTYYQRKRKVIYEIARGLLLIF